MDLVTTDAEAFNLLLPAQFFVPKTLGLLQSNSCCSTLANCSDETAIIVGGIRKGSSSLSEHWLWVLGIIVLLEGTGSQDTSRQESILAGFKEKVGVGCLGFGVNWSTRLALRQSLSCCPTFSLAMSSPTSNHSLLLGSC